MNSIIWLLLLATASTSQWLPDDTSDDDVLYVDSESHHVLPRVKRQEYEYDGGYEFSGSGDYESDDTESDYYDDDQVFIRITLLLDTEWIPELEEDPDSTEFIMLATDLSKAIVNLYENVEGNQIVSMIKFRETTQPNEVLVILDLGSVGNPETDKLRFIFDSQLNDGHLGGHSVKAVQENWWRVISGPGATTGASVCQENELFCKSGQCVPAEARCDGFSDCIDGTDEMSCDNSGCSTDQHKCDSGACIEKGLLCNGHRDCPSAEDDSDERNCPQSGLVPVPSPQPTGCRADTQIACPGSNSRICEVQWCDGSEDCPLMPGEEVSYDESNCVDPNATFVPPIDISTTEDTPPETFTVCSTGYLSRWSGTIGHFPLHH